MRIYTAPTAETLMRGALERLAVPAADRELDPAEVLATLSASRDPVVLCPTAALRAWLQSAWAKESGVVAGIQWLHPSKLLRSALGGDIAEDFFGERAVWVLYEKLRGLRGSRAAQSGAEAPLGLDAHERLQFVSRLSEKDLFAFARRVKDMFASYALYRPDWISAWIDGRDPKDGVTDHVDYCWQRDLFRALYAAGFSGVDALRDLEAKRFFTEDEWKGRRILVFMPTVLTPLVEKALNDLESVGAEVDVFVLDTNEAPRELFALKATKSRRELLARLRRMGEVVELPGASSALRTAPTNLERLRGALLEGFAEGEVSGFEYDESVTVVRTSDLVRSVETFADRLERLFKEDPTLKPHDVMMLFPDAKGAAGAVRAVLERRRVGHGDTSFLLIPYRTRTDDHETMSVTEAMLEALRLVSEKCTYKDWCAWLTSSAVLAGFGFSREDAEVAAHWLKRAGFAFGIDDAHLASRMQGVSAPDASATLEAALRRLVCGAVFADGRRAPFADGTLPLRGDDVDWETPSVAERPGLLEKLVGLGVFFSTLARETEGRTGPFAEAWAPLLLDAAETLFGSVRSLTEPLLKWRRMIGRLARLLCETPGRAGDASRVPIGRDALLSALEHLAGAVGEVDCPTDVVTAGGLRALSAIPARVVAVFGLSASSGFPKQPTPSEFDLLVAARASDPRPGDPDPEAEDWAHAGFWLQSARDRLHIGYECGFDAAGKPVDNPSAAVADLLRFSAAVLGTCRQTGDQGLPVVFEATSSAAPEAFRSGLPEAPGGAAAKGVPLRSWRSLDAKLCEAVKKGLPASRGIVTPSGIAPGARGPTFYRTDKWRAS